MANGAHSIPEKPEGLSRKLRISLVLAMLAFLLPLGILGLFGDPMTRGLLVLTVALPIHALCLSGSLGLGAAALRQSRIPLLWMIPSVIWVLYALTQ